MRTSRLTVSRRPCVKVNDELRLVCECVLLIMKKLNKKDSIMMLPPLCFLRR